MKHVTMYTDGACSGNPGPGGWGAILIYGQREKTLSGGEPMTTNNRMELTAAIEGLKILKEPCTVDLYTDSSYLSNAVNKGWLWGWAKKGWRKKDGAVKNPDLWKELMALIGVHDVRFIWVKGHSENEYNNRCDEMAVAEWKKFKSEK